MSESINAVSTTTAVPRGGPLAVPVAVGGLQTKVAERVASGDAPTDGDLAEAVQALQQQATDVGAELEFSIDRELDRVIVTLRDARDGSVLRQIPADEVLRIARMLRDERAPLIHAIV